MIVTLASLSEALRLTSGQRIASRVVAKHSNANSNDQSQKSLFDVPAVEAWGEERGLKEHHLKTLYRVIMNSPIPRIEEMNSLHYAPLEERLVEAGFPKHDTMELLSEFTYTCKVVRVEKSDGGSKFVIQLPSGKLVETVLIRHERQNGDVRWTVCVSSQVGCAKKCSFCATGTMGLQGQLSSAEILEQVFLTRQHLRTLPSDTAGASAGQIRNCVFMGMGEPLDNYDAVHEALRGLTHQCLFGFKAKQITVSTVGASRRKIQQLADDAPQVSLALSLHSATQECREKLIPAAYANPIIEVGKALDYHASRSGRGAMLEYLLIDNVNDSDDEVDALAKFCLERTGAVFVNLIPYNPTLAGKDFGYRTPADDRIYAFHDRLKERGIKSLIRWSTTRGRDANGACGQLALSSLDVQ